MANVQIGKQASLLCGGSLLKGNQPGKVIFVVKQGRYPLFLAACRLGCFVVLLSNSCR